MFGYVKPHVPELRVMEHELYRSVYCGLCAAMKKTTGFLSSSSLSYDMVFLAVLRMAVTGDAYPIEKKRCVLNPCRPKKRCVMTCGGELSYAASVSALMTELKLRDDINDEKRSFPKRTVKKLALAAAKKWKRRADIPDELEARVTSHLGTLYAMEAAASPSADTCAAEFGEVVGELCAYGLSGADALILREIGRSVGRFIYLADAADDIRDDMKSGQYNPIISLWRDEITDGNLSERAADAVSDSLTLELQSAGAAAELISVPDGGYRELLPIIENIIRRGMPEVAEAIVHKEKGKGKKS